MIPAPSNKKGHAQFRPFPTKEAKREANPFQQKRAGTKPTLFNHKSMQFSQRSSTTESDRFP